MHKPLLPLKVVIDQIDLAFVGHFAQLDKATVSQLPKSFAFLIISEFELLRSVDLQTVKDLRITAGLKEGDGLVHLMMDDKCISPFFEVFFAHSLLDHIALAV